MRRAAGFLAALLLASPAAAITVEEVGRPDGGFVADHAQLLDDAAEDRINAIAAAAEARERAQIAVVTIASTDGADARDFATRLFNLWGVGDAANDNGVLIFVAIDDRAAELILGDGIDDGANVAIADAIMQGEMVPRFRQGDAQGAILAGTAAAATRILGATLPDAPEASFAPDSSAAYSEAASPSDNSVMSDLALAAKDPDVQNIGLGVGGLGALGVMGFGLRRYLRYRPRRCDRCGAAMTLLDDASDDAHLGPSELKEESLKSVDYDLWVCSGCSSVSKLRYGAWFSGYAKCPQCNAQTKSSVETTLVAATYDSGGRVRVDETCEFCGYKHSTERSTPKKTRSSSSSSSFGGGSSSGRGSSGRW